MIITVRLFTTQSELHVDVTFLSQTPKLWICQSHTQIVSYSWAEIPKVAWDRKSGYEAMDLPPK